MVMAVGWPWATSSAKLGPESTAEGVDGPRISAITLWSKCPVSSSSPLVAQAIRALGLRRGFILRIRSRNAWLGTAIRINSAPESACSKEAVEESKLGKGTPGRYFAFSRSTSRCSICFGLWPQSFTAWPLLARWIARAVPHDPAPSTAMGCISRFND